MRRAVRIRLHHPPTSLRIQRFSAGFVGNPRVSGPICSLSAPETGEFEPHRGDFSILSLFRISLVPRENTSTGRFLYFDLVCFCGAGHTSSDSTYNLMGMGDRPDEADTSS